MSEVQPPTQPSSQKLTLLIVDDEASILKALKRLFHGLEYKLVIADSAQKALEFMQTHVVHVIISDMKMPSMDGPQFLHHVASQFPDTYRIVLSGYADADSTLAAINKGRIHRYLQKPWDNDVLIEAVNEGANQFRLAQQNQHLLATTFEQNEQLQSLNNSLEQKVEFRTQQIKGILNKAEKSVVSLKKALYNALSVNPNLDGGFAKTVSKLCEQIATELELDRLVIADIRYAGLISELGACGLPASTLHTPYNALSAAQQNLFYRQLNYAELIMNTAPELKPVTDIIICQYEYANGKGFNRKLTLDKIPIGARILAVARDYYRYQLGRIDNEKHNQSVTLQKMKKFAGVQYDPKIVNVLEKIVSVSKQDTNDIGMSSDGLEPNMVLKESLFNESNILVLPEGHVFDEASIKRLRALEQRFDMSFSILAELPK